MSNARLLSLHDKQILFFLGFELHVCQQCPKYFSIICLLIHHPNFQSLLHCIILIAFDNSLSLSLSMQKVYSPYFDPEFDSLTERIYGPK